MSHFVAMLLTVSIFACLNVASCPEPFEVVDLNNNNNLPLAHKSRNVIVDHAESHDLCLGVLVNGYATTSGLTHHLLS